MKIVIPTIGSLLDENLKSCEVFTIFTVNESNKIVDSEILCTPQGCDCKNNISLIIQQKGVSIMLAGTLPEYARGTCKQHGITVYLGYSGNVHLVSETFLLENK
jgi:predicted Fe-Mo cluster-binding NifX family protein